MLVWCRAGDQPVIHLVVLLGRSTLYNNVEHSARSACGHCSDKVQRSLGGDRKSQGIVSANISISSEQIFVIRTPFILQRVEICSCIIELAILLFCIL